MPSRDDVPEKRDTGPCGDHDCSHVEVMSRWRCPILLFRFIRSAVSSGHAELAMRATSLFGSVGKNGGKPGRVLAHELSFALDERVVLEEGVCVHEHVRVGGGALEGALGVACVGDEEGVVGLAGGFGG